MPIWPDEIEMPLPSSVIREATDPTIVTSRPSRIQTVPRPMTISQWKRDHGSRSSRAGMRVSMVPVCTLMARPLPPRPCLAADVVYLRTGGRNSACSAAA